VRGCDSADRLFLNIRKGEKEEKFARVMKISPQKWAQLSVSGGPKKRVAKGPCVQKKNSGKKVGLPATRVVEGGGNSGVGLKN